MAVIQQPLNKLILPCYYPLHQPNFKPSRIYLRGGRYSGKSTEVARFIVLSLLMHKDRSAICFRRFGNTLQGSVFNEIINAIYDLGVEDEFKPKYNPLRIVRKNSNQVIQFAMLNQPDDFRKIKSIKLVKSYFAYIWFEEADEFVDDKAIRQVLLSLFRNGQEFKVFYTFNTPFSAEHPLNVEWGTRKNYYYQHTSVYDLPPSIIPDEIWYEVNDMRKNRPKEFAHAILGQPGDPDAIMFPNIYRYTYEPNGEHAYFDNILRGLDFGFAPDPTAYTDWYYDKTHNDLFCLNEGYDYRLSARQIYSMVTRVWHSYGPITCDIDKRVIQELNEAGLYCWPAKKGANSRELRNKMVTRIKSHIH